MIRRYSAGVKLNCGEIFFDKATLQSHYSCSEKQQVTKVILASQASDAVTRDSVVTMFRIVNDEPPGRDRQDMHLLTVLHIENSGLACRDWLLTK